MFCSKCGAQNGGGNAFCFNCGAPLMNNAPTVPQQPPSGGPGYYPPPPQGGYNQPVQPGYYPPQGYGQAQVMTAPRKSNGAIIAVIIIAVVIILGVAAFFIFRGAGNPLIGTWTYSDYGYDITINFKGNGVVEGDFGGESDSSRYKVKGDVLTITDGDGSVYEYTYEITKEDGETILTLYTYGETVTLYKK